MTRFFCGILLFATFAGTLHAQGSKYTPVKGGTQDPEALKKLAAMLGTGGGKQQPIDPKLAELLNKWLKDTENDPEARKRMIDYARKQKEENPEQFQQDFKKNNPNISDDDLKKLMQNLGKPGDPPPVLPKPGDPPITPKPMPNPNVPPMPMPDPNGGFPEQPLPNPPTTKPPSPTQPKNAEQVEGAVQMWEQTVGPIDSTPAVKDAIIDLFGNGASGEKPAWMNSADGKSSSASQSSGFWKFLPMIKEARARRLQPLPGQGPWPVDPRTIHDRESLVIAFEYLSILVCGNGAVVWNHMTIAEALRDALPDREHLAEPLARLYAVARYTPLREEIPESAYAEARRCLCALAGVSAG